MSKAGIHSNRGDGYQTLVAFDWALTVLSDSDYQWIEVDSVTWSVDDVVIGKADGEKICCQCKKNQTEFKAWSVADLADELNKAIGLIANDCTAFVYFYSRSNFGNLAALHEYSTSYSDKNSYNANLGLLHKKTDGHLAAILSKMAPKLSTYEFISRTAFIVTDDLNRMQTLLHERLRQLVSNPSAAYNALWTHLDHLGMRINGAPNTVATQHRLSKEKLKNIIIQAGAMLIPAMDLTEVRNSFQSTSAIGRMWRRDVGNERISISKIGEILAAIEAKHRSILVTGLPGSGKTCVILSLQEELERIAQSRSDLIPLFIQAREFADFTSTKDREAQGLSEQWVERVARMADGAHVVVLIDSLDVLSIAREHGVLAYFLAQIDRLLLIPNVTVVTACRDFDRQYDRRIAQRTWDKEYVCEPLNWDIDVAPLLAKVGIDTSTIDAATRKLIRNPRELDLYVELAQKSGSFNIVTSHALAQRYLSTIIQADSALGDSAMQAIEAIAVEMLNLRSLTVPHQRFSASNEIKRALLSNNVLHEAQDGQLTFGHQTLLDVLVTSNAVRRGITLNEFIQGLPPVPFVRPSIRSFVTQLASGSRLEFRKQLRTVFMSQHAFHVRRLVAESFAELIPQDEDWPLVRDLHNQQREVFLVIYTQAVRKEWHFFWLKHLLPKIKEARDADGMTMHVHRVSQWINDDADGVLALWLEILSFDWVDKEKIARPLERALSDSQVELAKEAFGKLLRALLDLPQRGHSFTGRALARCIEGDVVEDTVLWQYITAEVGDEDVKNYRLDQKLHCQPHEFGDRDNVFLASRMRKSGALLDLAVADLERWKRINELYYGNIDLGMLLHESSYSDIHDQQDHRYINSVRVLLDAIQAGIVHHAITRSEWWQLNRQRLCFSTEMVLRYFAILACTAEPETNLDIIHQMLCDKVLLESALSFELGNLMQAAFLQLDTSAQDAIQSTLLTVRREATGDVRRREWMLLERAQLLIAIPRYLRSPNVQAALDECEDITWPLVRRPIIVSQGGVVKAPFSFEVFLHLSDTTVLKLLEHYSGCSRHSIDDFLTGGELEVGFQLGEAASRHPTRFMELLSSAWDHIQGKFRNDIMCGIAKYLSYKYGSLLASDIWKPVEEAAPEVLGGRILDELEKNKIHWHHNREASKAIESCAHVINKIPDATRLISLAMEFLTLDEESTISGDSVDLISVGINMARGNATEALMILANRFIENGVPWPDSLAPALSLLALEKNPSIRALLLRRMPYLQSHNTDFGWRLFELVMHDFTEGLWSVAEQCLYYAYHQRYDIVGPWLSRLYQAGHGKDLETWGRISALASLSKHKDIYLFLEELKALNSAEAWRGAASVWTHTGNLQQHPEQCFAGLEVGLREENQHAVAVACKFDGIFRKTSPLVLLPIVLLQRCFSVLEICNDSAQSDIYGFDAWLNAIAINDPFFALEAMEIYLGLVRCKNIFLYDHENNLTQLLTRLFAQAEEQEESDGQRMLLRVVAIQDSLLALGVNGVSDWLKVAERP